MVVRRRGGGSERNDDGGQMVKKKKEIKLQFCLPSHLLELAPESLGYLYNWKRNLDLRVALGSQTLSRTVELVP